MNEKTPGLCTLMLVMIVFGVSGGLRTFALEHRDLVGQKDGINLYVSFTDPSDPNCSTIICTLENTTAKPVPIQLQGAAEGYGFDLRLIGVDGKEIQKTKEWIRLYETGDSMHTRFGVLRTDVPLSSAEMDLESAFGVGWKSGVRLDIIWNAREPRIGPGPYGGDFGVGSGLEGSVKIRGKAHALMHLPEQRATTEFESSQDEDDKIVRFESKLDRSYLEESSSGLPESVPLTRDFPLVWIVCAGGLIFSGLLWFVVCSKRGRR